MPEFSGGLKGTGAAAQAFWGTIDELEATLASGLKAEAELVMTDAKENYVPVKDGILRAGGFVDDPEIVGTFITVTLGFGGAAEAYALVQHEHLEYKHTVGRSKFLELPMLAAATGLDQRLAARIRRVSRDIKTTGHTNG